MGIFYSTPTRQSKNKIYLTGSSAKLLSKEIATQLRGRSISLEIFPFSYIETLIFYNLKPVQIDSLHSSAFLQKRLNEYLLCGGFPEVQKLTPDLRIQVLQEYIDIVILRDIIERNNVSNTKALRLLVSTITKNPGDIFSVNKF